MMNWAVVSIPANNGAERVVGSLVVDDADHRGAGHNLLGLGRLVGATIARHGQADTRSDRITREELWINQAPEARRTLARVGAGAATVAEANPIVGADAEGALRGLTDATTGHRIAVLALKDLDGGGTGSDHAAVLVGEVLAREASWALAVILAGGRADGLN